MKLNNDLSTPSNAQNKLLRLIIIISLFFVKIIIKQNREIYTSVKTKTPIRGECNAPSEMNRKFFRKKNENKNRVKPKKKKTHNKTQH